MLSYSLASFAASGFGYDLLLGFPMTTEIRQTVAQLDALIRQHLWFDFSVWSYEGRNLVLVGSTDFTYYHELEITFHEVFFMAGYFREWQSDTTQPVFVLPPPEEAYQLNVELAIETGYSLFVFKVEGSKNDVVIAAEGISYNTDTVLYYYREDLQPGMRLAPHVGKA